MYAEQQSQAKGPFSALVTLAASTIQDYTTHESRLISDLFQPHCFDILDQSKVDNKHFWVSLQDYFSLIVLTFLTKAKLINIFGSHSKTAKCLCLYWSVTLS